MSELRKEFATLIRATLSYLQDEWGEHAHQALKEPTPTPTPPPSKPVIKPAEPIKKEEAKKPAEPIKKEEAKPIPEGNWKLNPMALPEERLPAFASNFTHLPLDIPIRLFATDPSQYFFLESVARAVTKFIAPAALYEEKLDTLLTNRKIQLVLAPISHLKKRFPQVELHRFLTLDGPALLPLADHYDLELKRALWDSLKSFRTTPPSS